MSMDKIVEVNTSDFICTVEPGVTHGTLNQHLQTTGLWFPGGMLAPNYLGVELERIESVIIPGQL